MIATAWTLTALIFFSILILRSTSQAKNAANKNWSCEGCQKEKVGSIYGAIHVAVQYEDFDIFLQLDNKWGKAILHHEAHVHVKNLPLSSLETLKVLSSKSIPSSATEQVYEVIFSEVKNSSYYHEIIDKFLVKNPCWIPLHEPNIALNNQTNLQYWLYHHHNNEYYGRSVIMVKLPSYPYDPTCQLFESFYSHQNPEVCPTTESAYFSYGLTAYGTFVKQIG
jgi:hypothetical protein